MLNRDCKWPEEPDLEEMLGKGRRFPFNNGRHPHNFRKKDRVIYVSGNFGDERNNPLWNGEYGQIIGTVINTSDNWIKVKWDNGYSNGYYTRDLEHFHIDTTGIFEPLNDLFL